MTDRPRKYNVLADMGDDTIVVGTDEKDVAEQTAKDFRDQGYQNVRIVERP